MYRYVCVYIYGQEEASARKEGHEYPCFAPPSPLSYICTHPYALLVFIMRATMMNIRRYQKISEEQGHLLCSYRVANTYRMPYVYRSFSAKEPCN